MFRVSVLEDFAHVAWVGRLKRTDANRRSAKPQKSQNFCSLDPAIKSAFLDSASFDNHATE